MYMMFIYCNKKPYNEMGIRGSLEELYDQARIVTEELLKKNPRAEITTKITMYI